MQGSSSSACTSFHRPGLAQRRRSSSTCEDQLFSRSFSTLTLPESGRCRLCSSPRSFRRSRMRTSVRWARCSSRRRSIRALRCFRQSSFGSLVSTPSTSCLLTTCTAERSLRPPKGFATASWLASLSPSTTFRYAHLANCADTFVSAAGETSRPPSSRPSQQQLHFRAVHKQILPSPTSPVRLSSRATSLAS